jgi:glycosyltransferase involved in cell wall biosynthesis
MSTGGRPDPWLSIVMPVWNGERYLAEALRSVREQGTEGYEVIAVDDGSSDRSPEILRAWERLLPLRRTARERGGNWVAASNAALREARGEYICFLHQDDLWLPGRLAAIQKEVAFAPTLVVHPAVLIGPDGRTLGTWRCPLPAGEVDPRLFRERLLVQNFIAIPAPVFARETALRLGGMDESLWYTADWDLWLRLGGAGAIRHFTPALAAFRVHPSSQTMVRTDLADRRRQLETVLERHAKGSSGPVRRAARFSVELNLALAAAAGGVAASWGSLFAALVRLGPASWVRYLRDSRIFERVGARIRLRGMAIARA